MRMNYKTYPTDYVQELNLSRGARGRKKSRAFMEYWNDMEHSDHNSESFYAKSWDVSPSTSHTWIKEFMEEIELFLSHWDIRNKQHYTYAKKQTEEQPSKTRSFEAQEIGDFRNEEEEQPREALNYYNKNNRQNSDFLFDKDYNDFFFVYSRNTRYPGKKQEAYEAFRKTDVDVNLLKLASMRYLHDKVVDKPVGVKKFLENEMYQPYLPKYMRVYSNSVWLEGIYNDNSYEFKTATGVLIGIIEPALLVSLFEKKELEYLKGLSC